MHGCPPGTGSDCLRQCCSVAESWERHRGQVNWHGLAWRAMFSARAIAGVLDIRGCFAQSAGNYCQAPHGVVTERCSTSALVRITSWQESCYFRAVPRGQLLKLTQRDPSGMQRKECPSSASVLHVVACAELLGRAIKPVQVWFGATPLHDVCTLVLTWFQSVHFVPPYPNVRRRKARTSSGT